MKEKGEEQMELKQAETSDEMNVWVSAMYKLH